MTAHSAARLAATRLSEQGVLGASTTRASAPDSAAHVADALRAMASQLQSLADSLAEASEPAAGQSLGADDSLTPAQEARLEAAVSRHRRRAKRMQPRRANP